ncbi:anti-phage dCTP deaminase [Pseudomonas sp. RC10]|uniref:anti-phage dCTP deaminase n=1 Tax=Pseudomonas bambusae TaxID=3139142 RepID=UPI003138B283
MRFNGNLIELKIKLKELIEAGEWKETNPNQHQFRTNNGAILNWYPSTGNINFQGKSASIELLKPLVEKLLSSTDTISNPGKSDNHYEPTETVAILAKTDTTENTYFLDNSYSDSEIVIGLVGAIGTDLDEVSRIISERLKLFKYSSQPIKISTDIIATLSTFSEFPSEYDRIYAFMAAGNELREKTGDHSVLALGAAAKINQLRSGNEALRRKAFIIKSLKHPEEVQRLRKIYSEGFFLLGVHADHGRRSSFLIKEKFMSDDEASRLIEKDADESEPYGQHTRDTYHLSDFFINSDGNTDSLKSQVWRVLDLLFGKPYITPTFDEYAMFMAFSASLRSADLSRQVGAVLTKNLSIVSTGANDVPKAHGGLYWPELDVATHSIVDAKDGRDYMRGEDSNAIQKKAIIDSILASIPAPLKKELEPALRSSKIKDITEYGRVVHAEMEALLSSARSGISTTNAELYCTTFPCHNCAKHIVAAGIKRVVYVEPYPKSKALQFHSDSISLEKGSSTVIFEPFIGVGPRSFFNLFSTNLGSGYPVTRKSADGLTVDWDESDAKLRTQMLPCSYMERETIAANLLSRYIEDK